jgi:hypothetical protein
MRNVTTLIRALPALAPALDDPLLPQMVRRRLPAGIVWTVLLLATCGAVAWFAMQGTPPGLLVVAGILAALLPLRWVSVELHKVLFAARLRLHIASKGGLQGTLVQIIREAQPVHLDSLRVAPIDGDRAVGLVAVSAVRGPGGPSLLGHGIVVLGLAAAAASPLAFGLEPVSRSALLSLLPLALCLALFEYLDYRDSLVECALRELIELHNDLLLRTRAEGCHNAQAFSALPSMPVRAIALVRIGEGAAVLVYLLGVYATREAPLLIAAVLVALGACLWEAAHPSRLAGMRAQFNALLFRVRTVWRVCWMEGW